MMIRACLVCSFLLVSCSVSSYVEPHYLKFAHRLRRQHIRVMEKRGFSVVMTGGGMVDNVDSISLGLRSPKTPTVEEARVMYVNGIEHFLALINHDEVIRPYLSNYPFIIKNLYYTMGFPRVSIDSNGKGPVTYVSISNNGSIYYCFYDAALESTNPLIDGHSEPYSEALRIVRESGMLLDLPGPS